MVSAGPGEAAEPAGGSAAASTGTVPAEPAGGHPDGSAAGSSDLQARARQICLNLLTTRARTRAELAAALARRGVDEDTASAVLARFSEVGLIDDAAFAQAYVQSGHAYRGLGRRALAAHLRRRGVDEQTTGEAIAAVEPAAEEEMARTLVRRQLARTSPATDEAGAARTTDQVAATGKADEVATIRKLVGMLARRGYPEGLSYRVVRDELRAAGQNADLLDEVDLDHTG